MNPSERGLFSAGLSALLSPWIRLLGKPSVPRYDGELTVPGLNNEVQVEWDDYGVPHVSAANERDLLMAQGYLHAQERLWQMDVTRSFLAGRTAEIFGRFAVPWNEISTHFRGKDTTDLDYFIRLMGIRRGAVKSVEILSDQERQRLQDYSDGINRYIEARGKRLPWEFRLLRYEPEPWRPEDSLTVGRGFAFLVSPALFSRLSMIALAAKLNAQPEKLRSLWPDYPSDGPVITQAVWDSTQKLWQFMSGMFAATDWTAAGQGSNSWVIAPERSAGHNAVLCNDPHLRLTLPSVWYLMHLKAAANPHQPFGYEVWGASIPGCPCIQIGHNRSIAWGITASLCDDAELYAEKIDPGMPEHYWGGDQWQPFESTLETIRIRGKRETKRLVRWTCHGPVISDFQTTGAKSQVLAFRWTAHDPSNEFRSVYGVNCARNWEDFLESLSFQGTPILNYVYADIHGNIGYSLAGNVPKRPKLPTLLPLDGWQSENEWRGYVPFDELPRLYNPPEAMIATANNRIAGDSYTHFLSHFFEPPYRIKRIKQLLSSKPVFRVQDLAEIQSDVVSLHATELVETLRRDLEQAATDAADIREAARRLLLWDGTCGTDNVEAALFHVFYYRLMANLLTPELGEQLFSIYVEVFNQCLVPVHELLREPASVWFRVCSRQELVTKSLRETCKELAGSFGTGIRNWQWGRIHTVRLDHRFSRVKGFRPLLSLGPLPSAGDNVTINMGFYRHSNPYQHIVGASMRMIVELDSPARLQMVVVPGQSGHPFSPHYRDQADLWLNGRYISLDGPENKRGRTLTLLPTKRSVV